MSPKYSPTNTNSMIFNDNYANRNVSESSFNSSHHPSANEDTMT